MALLAAEASAAPSFSLASGAPASPIWKSRRRRVYQSVFQTDISQPTPYSTPSLRYPEPGQAFGGHGGLPQGRAGHDNQHLLFPRDGTAAASLSSGPLFSAPHTQTQASTDGLVGRVQGFHPELRDGIFDVSSPGPSQSQPEPARGHTRPSSTGQDIARAPSAHAPPAGPSSIFANPNPAARSFVSPAKTLSSSSSSIEHGPSLQAAPGQPLLLPASSTQGADLDGRGESPAEDQIRFDRAWHVVTSRIALPSSATADDSFGTLAPDSQLLSQPQRLGLGGGGGAASEAEFYAAVGLVWAARNGTALPHAAHTEDILGWHIQQVRAHFSHHVLPLLAACADGHSGDGAESDAGAVEDGGVERTPRRRYETSMFVVMSSVQTLEGALRMYFYGLSLLIRGIARADGAQPTEEKMNQAELLGARFRRDVHALVSNSASPALLKCLRIVLYRLVGTILGMPAEGDGNAGLENQPRPAPPTEDNFGAAAARKRLYELVEQLYEVGLGGEGFQILFAEVMDGLMSEFVWGAYASMWSPAKSEPTRGQGSIVSMEGARVAGVASSSPAIGSLCDWVESHFARLAFEVLSYVTDPDAPDSATASKRPPVTLSDVRIYQSLALGRLAALRISELFDIVLAWPASRGALDDLRAVITTPARRLQLTDSFSSAIQTRLLHPGRSTLEILQTYIAMIRTFHVLDPSKVLLGRVVQNLQLYLCQREDAVRIVVTGLLASPEEVEAAKKAAAAAGGSTTTSGPFSTPKTARDRGSFRGQLSSPDPPQHSRPNADEVAAAAASASTKLVELAILLTDPSQRRGGASGGDDEELDWNDMDWVPDPVDAGANYKRPRSEDVIGTLISALGSPDAFIKEFQIIVAERLLQGSSEMPPRLGGVSRGRGVAGAFEQERLVLSLLKKRFGEAALQNCDVMIKDVVDSVRLDVAIRKLSSSASSALSGQEGQQQQKQQPQEKPQAGNIQYHSRILSRLFWPNLDREHMVLPPPVVAQQRRYEGGYEQLKAHRKLTWLDHLGMAAVELDLADRTVAVDCKTYEAAVIYAFGDEDDDADGHDRPGVKKEPARRTADELYEKLQMDEDLIAAALDFWVSKGVLRRAPGGAYSVVERLSDAGEAGQAAGPAGGEAPSSAAGPESDAAAAGDEGEPSSPRKAQARGGLDAKDQERRRVYWQYIRSMLTNASATMPLAQMAMMMKMLIPDGFPWSNEELQEFLGDKVAAGEMEIVGGKYRLVKK